MDSQLRRPILNGPRSLLGEERGDDCLRSWPQISPGRGERRRLSKKRNTVAAAAHELRPKVGASLLSPDASISRSQVDTKT